MWVCVCTLVVGVAMMKIHTFKHGTMCSGYGRRGSKVCNIFISLDVRFHLLLAHTLTKTERESEREREREKERAFHFGKRARQTIDE